MSVVVGDRRESRYAAVWHAIELAEEMTELCIRRLGIKDYDHMIRSKYFHEYGERRCPKEEQVRMIQEAKSNLMDYTNRVVSETRIAYTVKVNSLESCDFQLKHIQEAEMYCELMIGKLQNINMIFQVDLNIYRPYVESIDREIHLLRKWARKVKKKRKRYIG